MLTEENISLIREIYTQKSLSYYDDFSKVLEVTKLKDFYIKKLLSQSAGSCFSNENILNGN